MASKLYDVLIIGGGPAGISVATALVRQLQTAILFDSGVYRNARAKHMHTVPGFDHVDPAVFRAKAKSDLLSRYNTVEIKTTQINKIAKLDSGIFQATDSDGNIYAGRKVALATGVKDVLPDIEGYDECWGRGIFHCLFCHGYEEKGGDSAGLFAMGMFSSAAMISHAGNLALQLAKNLTVYTNGNDEIAADIEKHSAVVKHKTRVRIENRRIKKLKLISPEASDILVVLEDGTELRESFIAHHPLVELNGPFVSQLGLDTGPRGEIKVNLPFNETSVPGVFAAGDAASEMRVVTAAMYGGCLAGVGLVAQLQAEKAQNVLDDLAKRS